MQAKWLLWVGVVISCLFIYKQPKSNWLYYFITPDKLAYYHYANDNYQESAKHFTHSMDKANAYYQAGEFKKSIVHYRKLQNEVARFNLGNAYIYSGQYDKAVEAFEQALAYDVDNKAIQTNLAIAKMKVKELEAKAGKGPGKLGADDIVFDKKNRLNFDEAGEETVMAELDINDQKKAWLKQVNTTPEVFLKNKFLLQQSLINEGEG